LAYSNFYLSTVTRYFVNIVIVQHWCTCMLSQASSFEMGQFWPV